MPRLFPLVRLSASLLMTGCITSYSGFDRLS